ncbi:class I SAM-dependent methyltransferase [Sulfuriferula sp. GW1]|uniref:class I SAM-dependent methyltransferase n=1 Tax=Sulfuriferula sp. GW1 TaxID=3345111 RepID=UPI0039AF36FF
MSDNFYRAFEERYYAPRETIKTLRKQYLPFVTPLVTAYQGAPTFDIGCGRGEWLELMIEIGFKPYGVDLDEGMLNDCLEFNLPYEQGDAVAFLATLPSESQVVISAFHVVEHISFEQLRTVVSESLRVLKRGGLLIMETPNPENIIVATRNFYLDPTHHRPIPPQLLSFLPEYYGFERVKILRLQESAELSSSKTPTLLNVLSGASPDYAVVAQKAGTVELLTATSQAFEAEYGLTLETLAGRYDRQAEAKAQQTEAKAQQAEAIAQQAEARATEAEAHIEAMQNSRSWRITAPLRWTVSALLRLSPNTLKAHAKTLVRHAARYVIARPRLRNATAGFLDRYPTVKSRLTRILIGGTAPQITAAYVPTDLAHLTPHARQIYADLKAAIERRQKENS